MTSETNNESSPFLQYVSDVTTFDNQLSQYLGAEYTQLKYVRLFGCHSVDLSNTADYYARYTASFLCNGIVQNSRDACGLTDAAARPLCANACAELARSEETIISSPQLCSLRSSTYADQLRADFTNCALPANSLTGTCITGVSNEPNNCGFNSNLVGLCNYCRQSTENATDSCCFTSNTQQRCQNVKLPVFSSIAGMFSATSTSASSSPTSSTTASPTSAARGNGGLSGGAIAGIVIGALIGFALLVTLFIFACIVVRRRRNNSRSGSILNQPSPQRRGVPAMSAYGPQPPSSSSQQGYEVLPGGRVARMTALSGDDAATGIYDTEAYDESPKFDEKMAGIIGGAKSERSPQSDSNNESSNDYSSPEALASGQSEQLPYFKDYYSNDDIHPGDKVSVLWAYQPRAGDEFELERGDMLKVVGIWDDGWATGVRINERAEDYEGKQKTQRDSGVSNGTQPARTESPAPPGEIKAFPLVCVCVPEAWKKTVEGDQSGEAAEPPTM